VQLPKRIVSLSHDPASCWKAQRQQRSFLAPKIFPPSNWPTVDCQFPYNCSQGLNFFEIVAAGDHSCHNQDMQLFCIRYYKKCKCSCTFILSLITTQFLPQFHGRDSTSNFTSSSSVSSHSSSSKRDRMNFRAKVEYDTTSL